MNESYVGSDSSTTTKTINEKQIIDLIEVKEESHKYNSKAKETNSHKEFKVFEVLFNNARFLFVFSLSSLSYSYFALVNQML